MAETGQGPLRIASDGSVIRPDGDVAYFSIERSAFGSAKCNDALGEAVEERVAALVAGGYDNVVQHLREDGPGLLYRWLALVFLKTHLKDLQLRIAAGRYSFLFNAAGEFQRCAVDPRDEE